MELVEDASKITPVLMQQTTEPASKNMSSSTEFHPPAPEDKTSDQPPTVNSTGVDASGPEVLKQSVQEKKPIDMGDTNQELSDQSRETCDTQGSPNTKPNEVAAEKPKQNGTFIKEKQMTLSKSNSEEVASQGSTEEMKKMVVMFEKGQYTCCECNFSGKGNTFEEHLMCHLIKKPYQCLYCKEGFASRKEIGRHLGTAHKGMKLNCLLKALNRAKTLMLEAKNKESCTFLALVHGKNKPSKQKAEVSRSLSDPVDTKSLRRQVSGSYEDGSKTHSVNQEPDAKITKTEDNTDPGEGKECTDITGANDDAKTEEVSDCPRVNMNAAPTEAVEQNGDKKDDVESVEAEVTHEKNNDGMPVTNPLARELEDDCEMNENGTLSSKLKSESCSLEDTIEQKFSEEPHKKGDVQLETKVKPSELDILTKTDNSIPGSEVTEEKQSTDVADAEPKDSSSEKKADDKSNVQLETEMKPSESDILTKTDNSISGSEETKEKESTDVADAEPKESLSEKKADDKSNVQLETELKPSESDILTKTDNSISGSEETKEKESTDVADAEPKESLSEKKADDKSNVQLETELKPSELVILTKTDNSISGVEETEENESTDVADTEPKESLSEKKVDDILNVQLETEVKPFELDILTKTDNSIPGSEETEEMESTDVADTEPKESLSEKKVDDKLNVQLETQLKPSESDILTKTDNSIPGSEKTKEKQRTDVANAESKEFLSKKKADDKSNVQDHCARPEDTISGMCENQQEGNSVLEEKLLNDSSDGHSEEVNHESDAKQQLNDPDISVEESESMEIGNDELVTNCAEASENLNKNENDTLDFENVHHTKLSTKTAENEDPSATEMKDAAEESEHKEQEESKSGNSSEKINGFEDLSGEHPDRPVENQALKIKHELDQDKETLTSIKEPESMELKIVASYSLDGEDFSRSKQSAAADHLETEKSVDTSGVTEEDESANIQDTKDTSPTCEVPLPSASPSPTNNEALLSKECTTGEANETVMPKKTKLGQLLTMDSILSSEYMPSSGLAEVAAGVKLSGQSNADASSALSNLSKLLNSDPDPSDGLSAVSSAASVPDVQKTTPEGNAQPPATPGFTPAQLKHMRNPNFYVCGLNCNFSCLNSVEFRDHLFLGHAGEKTFPCYYCGWLSHTEEALLRHITNHAHTYSKTAPLYLCGVYMCKFGTNLLADLLNHMQILHADVKTYICKECNETYHDVKELVSHFEDNFIHVVNCPHCACKGTDRRMILKHISEYHPGKAKMVSVAKQIICKDRKVNNYKKVRARYKGDGAAVPRATPPPPSVSNIPETKTSVQSTGITIKVENTTETKDFCSNSPSMPLTTGSTSSATKQINTPKCSHCTFVARDQRRLESHVKCHSFPVVKKYRFRCMYCPQGFDNVEKFKVHINCHPGLIKYWMYYCKRCEFDSNQRYVMLRHIRTKDAVHHNTGNEEDMFSVVERIMESRVLECEHCNYQTRHKLHLQIHLQREHKISKSEEQPSGQGNKKTATSSFKVPWTSPKSNSDDACQENMSKKFKCPFCRYLVPKAADLKAHVKKHSHLGKITIDFLRCRYCSLSSTAREIVYSHIREKHAGKQLILVRKIVTIDTSGTENSFSETSVTEAAVPDSAVQPSKQGVDKFQCETCSFATLDREDFDAHVHMHNTTKGGIHCMEMNEDSEEDDDETGENDAQEDNETSFSVEQTQSIDMIEQAFVISETVAGDQLSCPVRCCSCFFATAYRSSFIDHMTTNHPSVMLVVRNKGTTVEQICPTGRMYFGLPVTLNNEVLLVPDKQVFTQPVNCLKCPNFATYFRRNLVLHLSKEHPEITAMGKCTWPGWQASTGGRNTNSTQSQKPSVEMKVQDRTPEKQDDSHILGSGDLDEQINCLYKNFGDKQQCLICNSIKPKKFFMHIHILRHLNIHLVKCTYCSHKGLQKYKVMRHIKTNHPEFLPVVMEIKTDIPRKVADFLAHQKKVVSLATNPSDKKITLQSLLTKQKSPESPETGLNRMSGPLGTPYLDEKLVCLYTLSEDKKKCSLCSVEFARKYAIHRHIVVNHLKVSLLKCAYCDFEGVEKHVIIDHILEQHKNQHIKFEPLDIDIEQKVKEFLNTYNFVKQEPREEQETTKMCTTGGPQIYSLGKDKLHDKLSPLFSRKTDGFKCNLCPWKFPRKYAIHRHILMKHMKIGLYGCTHCHFQGAEKYIVITHMREAHPSVPCVPRSIEVDMDQRIEDVLEEVANGIGSHAVSRRPYPGPSDDKDSVPYLPVVPKTEPGQEENKSQMVVAMFGKKRKPSPEVIPKENSPVAPKKLKTTSRMVDVTTKIRVFCIQDGNFKKFVCEECRFTSLHRSNVYRHVLRVHERYKELECRLCGYKTYSKVLMDQHLEVDHDGLSQMSHLTEKVSKKPAIAVKTERNDPDEVKHRKSLIPEHEEESVSSHPQEHVKHYACAYCNFETSTAERIIKHTRENHGPGGGKPEVAQPIENSGLKSDSKIVASKLTNCIKKSSVRKGTFTESQMLYCGYCTFKVPGVQAVKSHHKENHPTSKLCIISPQPWRYICCVCGLKNNAGSKMKSHLNRHLEYRPYTCSSCSQSYASVDELRKHTRNLHHSEDYQYLRQELKEKKINRYVEESRKNALLVNVGAPPDERTIRAETPAKIDLPNVKSAETPTEPKFKGIKRAMKMPLSPTKSLKKKYLKGGLHRNSRAVTKDIACHWCDIPHTVSVEQIKQHHINAHPDKEFLWIDTRLGNTCNVTGEIVEAGNLSDLPKITDAYTSKQLPNNKWKYYCDRCSFSASFLQAIVSHCRCHFPKQYLCAYCHLRYSNRDYLEKHQRTFHPGRTIWMLNMVESGTKTSSQPSEAAGSEQSAANVSRETTPASIDERRISQTVMYCCNYCAFEDESLYQYRLHLPLHGTFKYLTADLSTDSPLKCGFCPYVAIDQADFSVHITTHFENRSYKCSHCSYSAYTRAHVRFHLSNQHPELEQLVLDLSSAASYVEYLTADKTKLPQLVNLDPTVVLQDIMIRVLQNDFEDDGGSVKEEQTSETEFVEPDGSTASGKDDQSASFEGSAAKSPVGLEAEKSIISHDSEVSDLGVSALSEISEDMGNPSVNDVDRACSPLFDANESAEVVSSSVDLEAGGEFDKAEVSAFSEGDFEEGPGESESKQNSTQRDVSISDIDMLDSSVVSPIASKADCSSQDEVDGKALFEKLDVSSADSKGTNCETEDKKKDDSANVFDTLNSWLSMK